MKVQLYTDGGARNNPGPAGIGAVVVQDGVEIGHVSEYLGEATNNEAEYKAVIAGAALCKDLGATEVHLYSDSQLVICQMKGQWKVKERRLQLLRDKAMVAMAVFGKISFNWIRRDSSEWNVRADQLVNEAVDEGLMA